MKIFDDLDGFVYLFDTLHNSIGHCVTISMANMAEKIIAVQFFCSSI